MKSNKVFLLLIYILLLSCSKDHTFTDKELGNWQDTYSLFPGLKGRTQATNFANNDTLLYGFGDMSLLDSPIFNNFWIYTQKGWKGQYEFPGQRRLWPEMWNLNGKVYIGLGSDISIAERDSEFKDIWEYDLSKGTWDSLPFKFPGENRNGALNFILNNKIYYGGGVSRNNTFLTDLYIFDLKNGWSKTFYVERQSYRTYFTLNGEIYACFGKKEYEYFRSVQKFNPVNAQWEFVCSFDKEEYPYITRSEAKAFVIKEKEGEFVYIIGGHPEDNIPEKEFWQCCRFNPRNHQLEKVKALPVSFIETTFSIGNTGYIFDGEKIWEYIPE